MIFESGQSAIVGTFANKGPGIFTHLFIRKRISTQDEVPNYENDVNK